MNRALCLLALFYACMADVAAQDRADQAAAILERQKIDEDYRRLQATVNALIETQQVLQKRITALAEEVSALRRDQAQTAETSVTRDELMRLIAKLEKQLESKRDSDKKVILEAISGLRKAVASAPPPVATPPPKPARIDEPTYDYTVEKGNTVSDIIEAYNRVYKEEGRSSISAADVRRVNPEIDLNRIYPGQVIRIPEPRP